jgi:hypothetical protein
MNTRPVRLDLTTVTLLGAGVGEQLGLEHGIGHFLGQRPAQAGSLETSDRRPDGRCSHSNSTGDLTDRYATNELQPKNFAHLAHDRSLCWHPGLSFGTAKGARPESASRGTCHPGRYHPGMVGDIISERWASVRQRNRGACAVAGPVGTTCAPRREVLSESRMREIFMSGIRAQLLIKRASPTVFLSPRRASTTRTSPTLPAPGAARRCGRKPATPGTTGDAQQASPPM